MGRRSRTPDDLSQERERQGAVDRLLAPIAAVPSDVATHAPLVEAEHLRRQAATVVRTARDAGSSWREVRATLRGWAAGQRTPVQDALGLPTPSLGAWPIHAWTEGP
jgi:hypothetical protein